MSLSARLLEILVCPKCKSELEYRESEQALLCHKCRLRYAVRDDIPIMLIDEATPFSHRRRGDRNHCGRGANADWQRGLALSAASNRSAGGRHGPGNGRNQAGQ